MVDAQIFCGVKISGVVKEPTIKVLRNSAEVFAIQSEWEQCRKSTARPCLDQHPRALEAQVQNGSRAALRVITIWRNGRFLGAAPFVIRENWQFAWALRELGLKRTLARFPLKLADFSGSDFVGSFDHLDARQLLHEAFKLCADCEVIRMNQLNADSPICQLIQDGSAGRAGRWVWNRREREPRWLVRICATFDDYLQKFSGKKRRYLRWEIRQLENRFGGCLSLTCASEPAAVFPFIEAAEAVSTVSWQGKPFTRGQKHNLAHHATHGWLRCYLLSGSGQPLAYVIGRLSDGVFLADEAAFDARHASFSPGKVLWYKVIQDLHKQGGVSWLDFGSNDIGYKQFWAQERSTESSMYLIKRELRNALAFWPMIAVRWPVLAGRRLFEALGSHSLYDRSLHRLAKALKRKRRKRGQG